MNVFQRSWHITKLTFSVIKQDKVMLLFPILSGIFSIIFILAMVVPSLFFASFIQNLEITGLILIFFIYLGLAFITVFFDVCVVYVAKKRFKGEPVGFSQTLSYAFSKLWLIFLWSLVSAIVGVLLRIIEAIARNAKGPGRIIGQILVSFLGMAWSIVTIFVIPSLVYDNLKPFAAIKKSATTLKKTWGESLIRYFGFGLIQFIVMVIVGIVLIPLTVVSFMYSTIMGGILLVITIISFVLVFLVFHVAHDVFNTALYEYAQNGKIPEGFDKTTLENAFSRQ